MLLFVCAALQRQEHLWQTVQLPADPAAQGHASAQHHWQRARLPAGPEVFQQARLKLCQRGKLPAGPAAAEKAGCRHPGPRGLRMQIRHWVCLLAVAYSCPWRNHWACLLAFVAAAPGRQPAVRPLLPMTGRCWHLHLGLESPSCHLSGHAVLQHLGRGGSVGCLWSAAHLRSTDRQFQHQSHHHRHPSRTLGVAE